jgi:hypothetical protein
MCSDLHKILAGIAVRCSKPGHQCVVEPRILAAVLLVLLLRIEHLSKARLRVRKRVAQPHQSEGNGDGLRPGETNDADTAATRWRRDGNDRVVPERWRTDEFRASLQAASILTNLSESLPQIVSQQWETIMEGMNGAGMVLCLRG